AGALVALACVAPEEPVLQPPAGPVGVAVQVHEHVGHDDLALVVEGLAQVLLAEGVAGALVGGDGVDRGGGAHGWLLPGSGSAACARAAQVAARPSTSRWTGWVNDGGPWPSRSVTTRPAPTVRAQRRGWVRPPCSATSRGSRPSS